MWTLVYNQLGRAGEARTDFWIASWHSRYWCATSCQCLRTQDDSDIEDIIVLIILLLSTCVFVLPCSKINTNLGAFGRFRRRHSPLCVELQGTDSGKRTGEGTAPGGDDKSSFGYA